MNAREGDLQEGLVLVLAPTGRDAELTTRLLAEAGIPSLACDSTEALCQAIPRSAAALLAEEALDAALTTRLVESLEGQPPWSDLPVAIFRNADAGLTPSSLRLLARANVTLLERPVRRATLVTTVRSFLRARRRQLEVRDLVLQHEEAVRARDRFLAILGHELRNPLGAVLIATERMERLDRGAFRGERDVLQRQARVLTRLVDDLLDVGRVTTGKIVLKKTTVNLADVARRVVAAARETAGAGSATVTLEGTDRPFFVHGDPVRLEQVLNNLVTNAVKYTPPEGRVTVSVSEEGGRVVARVADTGVGIAPDVIEHVFELFTQAETSLDRAQGGMGIGLTLVKSLVELHGGTVRAESAGVGRGSTFTISLPPDSSVVDTTGSFARPAESEISPRRIVVVEDNADLREQLVALLRDSGHLVEAASDGLSGVERIAATRPEIALVDIGLPGIDGYEVARRVRAAVGDGIELVALTGYGQPDDRRRALEAGFDTHLTKPVTVVTLEALVESRTHRSSGPVEAPSGS